jgi:hypothetical protein
MVRENEQRAMIGASKDKVEGAFWHIDSRNLFTLGVINKDLPIRNVHIALAVSGNTFSAPLDKGVKCAECAIGTH